MTDSPSIVEFLTARYDEAHRYAYAAQGTLGIVRPWYDAKQLREAMPGMQWADCMFIERQTPARILADIAARRQLLDWVFKNAAQIDGEWGDGHSAEQIRAGECTDYGHEAAMTPLRMLAAQFAGHSDFSRACRIDG